MNAAIDPTPHSPWSRSQSPPLPPTALVTIVHGRHEHLRAHLDSVRVAGSLALHVVVAMDDPEVAEIVATDRAPWPTLVAHTGAGEHGLPLARARNVGARIALEHSIDVLVFLDVDCLASPGLFRTYAGYAAPRGGSPGPRLWCGAVHYLDPRGAGQEHYTAADLADSSPHPARPSLPTGDFRVSRNFDLFWSLSFAVSGPDWISVGGFDEDYSGYGAEDTDLGRRVAAHGGTMCWVGGAEAYHQHHPSESPPRQHVASIVRNANLFRDRWGDEPMRGWIDAFIAEGLVVRRPEDQSLEAV